MFATNKHYSYTKPSESDPSDVYCAVTNLSVNGLFGTISNAYIGSIKLGNFAGLTNSGALGTSIVGETTVNNIEFMAPEDNPSIISGNTAATNYFGGLFGIVGDTDGNGKLTVKLFNSSLLKLIKEGATERKERN